MLIQHCVYSVVFGKFSRLYLLFCLIARVHFPPFYFTFFLSNRNVKEKLERAIFASIDRLWSSFYSSPCFNPFPFFCARGIKHGLGVFCPASIFSSLSFCCLLQAKQLRIRSRIHVDIVAIGIDHEFSIDIQRMQAVCVCCLNFVHITYREAVSTATHKQERRGTWRKPVNVNMGGAKAVAFSIAKLFMSRKFFCRKFRVQGCCI